MTFFKDLSPEEEAEYRKWARDNYKPLSSIEGIWHPVVQDECIKINKEQQQLHRDEYTAIARYKTKRPEEFNPRAFII